MGAVYSASRVSRGLQCGNIVVCVADFIIPLTLTNMVLRRTQPWGCVKRTKVANVTCTKVRHENHHQIDCVIYITSMGL